MATLRELSYHDCERLLQAGVAGRAAVCTPAGPHIVPVNYWWLDRSVVLRTTPYSTLGTYGRGAVLAFEVDHFDPATQHGWSVVARGRAESVTDQMELNELREASRAGSWAEGTRNLYLRLRYTELTGRQLGPYDDDPLGGHEQP